MIRTSIALLSRSGACDRLKCVREWRNGRPEEELFPLRDLLDVPGLNNPEDTIWSLRAVPPEDAPERDRVARLFVVICAERALRRERETDPRLWRAVEVARRFALGEATKDKLAAARAAADAAVEDAWAAAQEDDVKDSVWIAAGATDADAAWAAMWAVDEHVECTRVLTALLEEGGVVSQVTE